MQKPYLGNSIFKRE